MNNFGAMVSIHDHDCPEAGAGLLISPRNLGTFLLYSKQPGTLLAILDVVNEKSTDPAHSIKLTGDGDYLLVGGSNAGKVDITSTGYASVVGLKNEGEVSIDGVANLVVGHVVNSGNVVIKSGTLIGNVKENTGTITIASGVTGNLLFCKNSGKIQNNGEVKISENAGLCMPLFW